MEGQRTTPAPKKCVLFYDRLDAFKDFTGVLESADMDEEDLPAPIQHYGHRIGGEIQGLAEGADSVR